MSSLMVRPSSRITCSTSSAISGGREKVMVLVFLGVDGIVSLFASCSIRAVLLYTNGLPASNYQGTAAKARLWQPASEATN